MDHPRRVSPGLPSERLARDAPLRHSINPLRPSPIHRNALPLFAPKLRATYHSMQSIDALCYVTRN